MGPIYEERLLLDDPLYALVHLKICMLIMNTMHLCSMQSRQILYNTCLLSNTIEHGFVFVHMCMTSNVLSCKVNLSPELCVVFCCILAGKFICIFVVEKNFVAFLLDLGPKIGP